MCGPDRLLEPLLVLRGCSPGPFNLTAPVKLIQACLHWWLINTSPCCLQLSHIHTQKVDSRASLSSHSFVVKSTGSFSRIYETGRLNK